MNDEKNSNFEKMMKIVDDFSKSHNIEKETLNRKEEFNKFNEHLLQNPPKENIIRFIEGNLNNDEVDKLNKDSLLPVKFLSNNMLELHNQNIANLIFIRNYMSYDYRCDDFELKYAGYPTDEDEYKMNYIKFNTNKYNFIGITIGKQLSDAELLLKKYDFVLLNEEDKNNMIINKKVYKNKNCVIEIYTSNNIISQYAVLLGSKYLGNNMY